MAIAASWRTADTTSTNSRGTRRSRRSATCCGIGRLPNRAELGDLQSQLVAARPLPEAVIRAMRMLPPGDGMDALRTLTSVLAHYDPDASDNSPPGELSQGRSADVAAQHRSSPRWAASSRRRTDCARSGARSRRELPLHADRASARAALATRAFDVALILHADHELNASTFAARVIAATLSDIHSAIVGGIGALKGPLHGGANAEVMKMLLDIGTDAPAEKAEEVVRAKLARKEKIPGFGHRVYHTEDPRATHLRQMSKDLGKRSGSTIWYEMSQRIEALVKAEKKLNPNVDFYSASTYHALGIPIDLFTPIFAVSRISGWTAHVLEQYANNRLIRPRADYIGPEYPQRYVPSKAARAASLATPRPPRRACELANAQIAILKPRPVSKRVGYGS